MSCSSCKGDPRGVLMLEGYLPCLDCGPKEDSEPTFEDAYARREAAHYGRDVPEGIVLKEAYQRLKDKVQAEDRIARPGGGAKACKFLGEKGKTYRITLMSDAHIGDRNVQEIAAQVKAGTNPILNWLLDGTPEASRSSTKSEEELEAWMPEWAKDLARLRGLSLDDERIQNIVKRAEKNVQELLASEVDDEEE